jgi:uncharacterized protein involved in exopolysaccharide biosynthesis
VSSHEESKGMSRLPNWRTNEHPPEVLEGARVRGPLVKPSDFVRDRVPPPQVSAETTVPGRLQPDEENSPERVIGAKPPLQVRQAEPMAAEEEMPPATPAPKPASQVLEPVTPVLDLRSIVRAIWARRKLVAILALVFAIVGAALIPLLPRKYTSEASLYFDPHNPGVPDSQQVPVAPELIQATIGSQTQILSSGKVLGRVVDALKLDRDPQFGGAETGEAAKYSATAVLRNVLLITREPNTYVVSLKVTTNNAEKSAQIANQIVASFADEESKSAANTYRSANTVLDSRLDDLRRQVLDAEKAVETYRADNDMAAVQGSLISDKRLNSLNDLLVTAQQKTIDAKARADSVDKLSFEDVVSTTRPDALNSASNSLTNLRQQYASLAATVGSLESQLGARHPRLLAARSSLESVAGEIRSELQRLATSAKADYSQAQKAEQDVAKELAVQKALQVNTSGKLVELNELQRKATAARDIYETLMKRSDQTSEDQRLTQTNIRVISEAQPPIKADGPGRMVMMMAGFVAGALLGLGIAALIAIGGSIFRHPVIRSYLSR